MKEIPRRMLFSHLFFVLLAGLHLASFLLQSRLPAKKWHHPKVQSRKFLTDMHRPGGLENLFFLGDFRLCPTDNTHCVYFRRVNVDTK